MVRDVIKTRPDDVNPGDVFVVTVAFHVSYLNAKGQPIVTAYRCPYPDPETDPDHASVPQGNKIAPEDCKYLMKSLAPVLDWAEAKAI